MEKPKFDFNKLRGCIKAYGMTEGEFAEAIGTSPSTFSLKLSGEKAYFSAPEIICMAQMLNVKPTEFKSIFFAERV